MPLQIVSRLKTRSQTNVQGLVTSVAMAGLLLSTISCSATPATDMNDKKAASVATPAATATSALSDVVPTTIILSYRQATKLAKQGMTIEVTEVTDSRCPPNTRCVWAGQATVSFKVSQPGTPEALLVIGTPAPAAMNLPADANYGGYRFSLVNLEPKKVAGENVAPEAYKAEIMMSKADAAK